MNYAQEKQNLKEAEDQVLEFNSKRNYKYSGDIREVNKVLAESNMSRQAQAILKRLEMRVVK